MKPFLRLRESDKRPSLNDHFFQCSNYIFDYDLKPASIAVYLFMRRHTFGKMECVVSNSLMVKKLGLHSTTVRAAIAELVLMKFVAVSEIGGGRDANKYVVRDPPPLGEYDNWQWAK